MKLVLGFVDDDVSLPPRSDFRTFQSDVWSFQTNLEESFCVDSEDITLLLNGYLYEKKENDLLYIQELYRKGGFEYLLKHLDGLFSLVLFDKKLQKLYLSRDHLGIYPLYYYKNKNTFLFSNDLKQFRDIDAFEKEIDYASLSLFFQHSFIPAPYTIFKNCYKLKPAHYLTFTLKEHRVDTKPYWDLHALYLEKKRDLDESVIVSKTEALLTKAIEDAIREKKEVGSFLSGGFDSTTILALLKQIGNTQNHTFTMGFENESYSEADIAKEIAKHLESHHDTYILQEEDVLHSLEDIATIYPEPFGDKAALASSILLQEHAKKSEVFFGGEGGDELFYASSFLTKFKRLENIPYAMRRFIGFLLKLHPGVKYQKWGDIYKQRNLEDLLAYKDILMSQRECQKLIQHAFRAHTIQISDRQRSPDSLDNFFPAIIQHYVSNNLLTKIGALSLYHDITIELPYLNRHLIEYLAKVSSSLKYKKETKKYLLKQITYKYVPKSIIDRPKKGFSVPLSASLRANLDTIKKSYLSKEKIENEAILDYNEVEKIVKQFLQEDSFYAEQKFWNLLLFEVWYDYWFDQDKIDKEM